jgi:hypothetical protein
VETPVPLKLYIRCADKLLKGYRMTISDYQINSVIKTYMRNMKNRMDRAEVTSRGSIPEDRVMISDDGMKKILFERIGEKMTERLRRHDQEE